MLPLFLFGQNSNNKKKEGQIVPVLCHIWNVDFKIDSIVNQHHPPETFSTINFIANGSLIINIGYVVQGSWKYYTKTNILSLKIKNDVLNLKVLKLTDKDMIFEKKNINGVVENGYMWRSD